MNNELLGSSEIQNDETVVRYLKRRYFDPDNQQWSTDVFELRSNEDYISVCRESLLESVEKGVELSFPEKMWHSIIAHASMSVSDIRILSTESVKVDVVPCPSPLNPSHAGITAAIDNKRVVGKPVHPAYYNLQSKLLELAIPTIMHFPANTFPLPPKK